MMQFDILTLFPEIFPNVLETSILGRAAEKKLLSFRYTNIRDYSKDKHKKVDDYPYGGGCGMVMQPQPIYYAYSAVTADCSEKPLTVVMSPRGRVFNQEIAKEMVTHNHIVLICGHYEGIDQRLIDEIADYELSIGDFVLTGGELGAMVVCDAVSRLVPGVLAEEESFTGESHYNSLLEYPQYTRPPIWMEREVPEVLLTGNRKDVDEWRTEQSLLKTETVRPDLYIKTEYPPYCVRKLNEISTFNLIAYSDNVQRDEIYKLRRKISRKLSNQGFEFTEVQTVFSGSVELQNFLNEQGAPSVLVVNNSNHINNLNFSKNPVLVLSGDNLVDSGSLHPYFATTDIHSVHKTVLNFLSVIRTVLKYGKNI